MDNLFKQVLYSDLYLFVALELGAAEVSTIDLTERCTEGRWRTVAHTGVTGGCGMHLHRPPLHPHPVYRLAPVNTAWFASTGGDGIFYSFLLTDIGWSDDSPVVVTFPGTIGNDEPSWIAGACLRDFLRLGCRVGYFALPDLVSGAVGGNAESIAQLESSGFPEWIGPDEKKQLKGLAKRFGLKPLDDVARRVAEWQRLYLPLVRHPGVVAR